MWHPGEPLNDHTCGLARVEALTLAELTEDRDKALKLRLGGAIERYVHTAFIGRMLLINR
jgi:hypothetical protein